ncbi:MAG: single-stranded DNA-binding protein [Pseudanabaenaceae cyanobacterium]
MNSIVLMAEILTDPEKRLTADGQYTVASFMAQFPNPRQEDAPFRVRVTGWNRLADEIIEKYHRGDQVIVEGRLRMELIDRGAYKEKVAEITAQRVYSLGASGSKSNTPTDSYSYANSAVGGSWSDHSYQNSPTGASVPRATVPAATSAPVVNSQPVTSYPAGNMAGTSQDYDSGASDDDIPF